MKLVSVEIATKRDNDGKFSKGSKGSKSANALTKEEAKGVVRKLIDKVRRKVKGQKDTGHPLGNDLKDMMAQYAQLKKAGKGDSKKAKDLGAQIGKIKNSLRSKKETAASEEVAATSVYGAVIVDGKKFQDNEITSLVGKNVGKKISQKEAKAGKKGWAWSGSQGEDESNVAIGKKSFGNDNGGLPAALKYLGSKKETAASEVANTSYSPNEPQFEPGDMTNKEINAALKGRKVEVYGDPEGDGLDWEDQKLLLKGPLVNFGDEPGTAKVGTKKIEWDTSDDVFIPNNPKKAIVIYGATLS